jgi:hypothetical protein
MCIKQIFELTRDTGDQDRYALRCIMTFNQISMSPPAACLALHRGRKKLRARVAALRPLPDAEFTDQFGGMVAAVEAGFRHEETLLEMLGDACLHPRLADHAVLLCALHRVAPQVESGDVDLGRQVVEALGHALELPLPVTPPRSVPRHVASATYLRHASHGA